MEVLLTYLLCTFVQAILVCRFDSESDRSFGWTMFLWVFGPVVTLVLIAQTFYILVLLLVGGRE